MPNKVTWKKGMRLSTEIFNSMDAAHDDVIRKVSEMASAGRFGLFPASKPFDISVNVSNDILEVVSLRCHGITKGGHLIDIDFDSNYSNTLDTRIQIPPINNPESLLLIVRIHESEWREINEIFSEALYTFELVGVNSKIDDNCLPIGCLVNQYGWRLDETDFVPPALFVSAHSKFEEQRRRALSLVKDVCVKCMTSRDCVAKKLLSSIWSTAAASCQRLDKERETLTPGQLYSIVQQYVSAFIIGCALDDYVSLEDEEPYILYSQKPLDLKSLYRDIEAGLTLCAEISVKMDAVCTITEVKHTVEEHKPVEKVKNTPAPKPTIPGRKGWDGRVI